MASAAVQTAMNLEDKKTIHPFFSKQTHVSPEQTSSTDPVADQQHHDSASEQPSGDAQPKRDLKRRNKKGDEEKVKPESNPRSKNQPSLERFTRPSVCKNASVVCDTVEIHDTSLENDPNQNRRKRRKTNSPTPPTTTPLESDAMPQGEPSDWHHQLQAEAGKCEPHLEVMPASQIPEEVVMATTEAQSKDKKLLARAVTPPVTITRPIHQCSASGEPIAIREGNHAHTETTPKILKITKSGKLVSSPPAPEQAASAKPRRGRKRAAPKPSPTVTIIKYGSDATSRLELGQKIDGILDGTFRFPPRPTAPPKVPPKAPVKRAAASKVTHPFFTGKANQRKEDGVPTKPDIGAQQPPSPRKVKSAVTPGKLRNDSRVNRLEQPAQAFGALAGDKRLSKGSGLTDVPWPSKETIHVRNLDEQAALTSQGGPSGTAPARKSRKLKSNVIMVPQHEDLCERLGKQLCDSIHQNKELLASGFLPPEDVRLPKRLLTTGSRIQEQVRREVRANLPPSTNQQPRSNNAHPAVSTLFTSIEHSLTPFDQGLCETQAWTQKHAPQCASQVLIPGREATVLHDWLQGLTVVAVESSKEVTKTNSAYDAKKPPKKRRKKAEDDFIVFDEEEEDDFIEISDGEEYGQHLWGMARQRSLKRPRLSRTKNVVIVSGPYGCGKSAMVYAVAKELDFDVFEINAGGRRSGKDIQDKVGDMSENHLVNHKRNGALVKQDQASAADDDEHIGADLQNDIDSGRQGTMTAFFKSNTRPRPKERAHKALKAPISTEGALPDGQPQRKSQKQSLILFEEADVLFEEDQQFWTQVTKLASQSKRPIIITCNDESVVPYDLPIGAILRLSPAPVDLATDYMLVLAAKEGHLLKRKAVADLYKSKNNDLRASITELDFWCQMSVGDRKGGLEWIYQRWPPGNDVDEYGRLLRVASEDTYEDGMGWLSHNVAVSQNNIGFNKQEELVKEVWENWGIRPNEWSSIHGHNSSVNALQHSHIERISELQRLDALAESISAADVYSRIDMPSYDDDYKEPMDPTLPPLPEKARFSYTTSAPVMQVDHASDFLTFDTNIFVASHLQAQNAFSDIGAGLGGEQKLPVGEKEFTDAVLRNKFDKHDRHKLSRPDFSAAFDVLAAPPSTTPAVSNTYPLTASSFDRTFRIVVDDLAPYVRSIVAHEQILEGQRIRLSNLLSEGGTGKRARTTRASRTAMEGGSRGTKRRERWFEKELNFDLVMATAGKSWTGMGSGVESLEMSSRAGDSQSGTQVH
ncbi:hypothetical protein BS50DRAFT_411914 [Corynespora cassiicola Philippines]|uniref:AAA+ ATPase domain-containing protein n=1 Tax=Corynespora cassiicola Philippines TaxID=1448308 RepID=A0A2T2NLP2_CORCC|nr:hypothetical protein BS50DRAFT_411914 [Corynespora cassiicola Philippines]